MDPIVNNSSDFDSMEDESGSFGDFMRGIENDMLNLMKETAKGKLVKLTLTYTYNTMTYKLKPFSMMMIHC